MSLASTLSIHGSLVLVSPRGGRVTLEGAGDRLVVRVPDLRTAFTVARTLRSVPRPEWFGELFHGLRDRLPVTEIHIGRRLALRLGAARGPGGFLGRLRTPLLRLRRAPPPDEPNSPD